MKEFRLIEKSQTTPRVLKVHHLKITGDQANIAKFLVELRGVDFGGHPTVVQQYSANRVAVNIESDGPIDITKITESASQHHVELEWVET